MAKKIDSEIILRTYGISYAESKLFFILVLDALLSRPCLTGKAQQGLLPCFQRSREAGHQAKQGSRNHNRNVLYVITEKLKQQSRDLTLAFRKNSFSNVF